MSDQLAERPPVDPDPILHTQEADANGVWCREDGQRWPCDTVSGRPPVDQGLRAAGHAVIFAMRHEIGLSVEMTTALAVLDARLDEAGVATPSPEGLDEVQAALPEGWSLMVGYTTECPFCPGWWATASKRPESPADYSKIVTSESDRPRGSHHDATSAEAIRALLRRLSERTDR